MRIHRPQGNGHRFAEAAEPAPPGRNFAQRRPGQRGQCAGPLAIARIRNDRSVADFDDPRRLLGNLGVMRNDDDGVAFAVELGQQRHKLGAAAAVECPGGLVRKDNVAAIHQRPRHADPLLLAA